MIKIILDSNIWISFVIGGELRYLEQIFLNPNIQIFICPNLIDEFETSIKKPKLAKYILFERIQMARRLMMYYAINLPILSDILSISRDAKDDYLLAFSKDYELDYLVTGDKDLLVLNIYCNTKIIDFKSFRDFCNKLSS